MKTPENTVLIVLHTVLMRFKHIPGELLRTVFGNFFGNFNYHQCIKLKSVFRRHYWQCFSEIIVKNQYLSNILIFPLLTEKNKRKKHRLLTMHHSQSISYFLI